MDDPKEFIRNGVLALIKNGADDEEAKMHFIRAIEIKTEKIIDEITINSDWEDESN